MPVQETWTRHNHSIFTIFTMTKTGALQQWKFKSSMGRRTQFFTFSALNALASPLKQPLTWTTKCCKQLIGKGLVYLHMTSTANDSTFRIMGSTCKVHNIPLPPGGPLSSLSTQSLRACSKHGQSSSFQTRILDGAATLCVADWSIEGMLCRSSCHDTPRRPEFFYCTLSLSFQMINAFSFTGKCKFLRPMTHMDPKCSFTIFRWVAIGILRRLGVGMSPPGTWFVLK